MARDVRVSESRNPTGTAQPRQATRSAPSTPAHESRSKLSVNVSFDISERLRSLAYLHRLSESSIVEIALAMFFARGDDELLGVMLKQLGATRRSK
jgi:hypothetical protein